MINLLGPDRKKQIRAARRNSIWIRYIFLISSASLAILIILGGASFYFYNQQITQEAKLKANQEKQITKEYKEAQQKVTDFQTNIKTAKAVFGAETYYSVIILEIAKTMPKKSVLASIKFDSTTFNTQQTITFRTKDVATAINLKERFESNETFSSKVRFSQITKPQSNQVPADKEHPVEVIMYMDLKKTQESLGSGTIKTGGTN